MPEERECRLKANRGLRTSADADGKMNRPRRETVRFLITDLCGRLRRRNVFLDGPAAGPTQALLSARIRASRCIVSPALSGH
jgi:hypothetical protein